MNISNRNQTFGIFKIEIFFLEYRKNKYSAYLGVVFRNKFHILIFLNKYSFERLIHLSSYEFKIKNCKFKIY